MSTHCRPQRRFIGTIFTAVLIAGTATIAAAENTSAEKIRQVFPSIVAGMVCSPSSPWISCGVLKLEECDETVRDAIAPCLEKHFTDIPAKLSSDEESVLNRMGALCTIDGLFQGKGKEWRNDGECSEMRTQIFAGVEKYRRGDKLDPLPASVSKETFQVMVGDSFGRDLCERGGAQRCLDASLPACVERMRPLVDSCVKKVTEPLPAQLTGEMGGQIGRSSYLCIEENLASDAGRTQYKLSELGAPGCGFHVN